jgi:hypothetical protein
MDPGLMPNLRRVTCRHGLLPELRHIGIRGLRANCADMLIPTMSGKENAGAARVKATRITTQRRHRLEASWAREHTHRMVGMRT